MVNVFTKVEFVFSVKFSSPYSQGSAPLLATRKVSLSLPEIAFL